MAEQGVSSPFAPQSKVSFAPDTVDTAGTAETLSAVTAKQQRSNSYKLVASPSGKDLFVETKAYDPFASRKPRDAKGEGLGFLCGCFSCFGASVKEPVEPAATAERHYSLPPAENAAVDKTD